MYSEVLKSPVHGVSLVKQSVNVKAVNDSVSVSPVWGCFPRVTACSILYRARQHQNYNCGIVLHSTAWTAAAEESRTIQPSAGRDSAGLISPGHTGQPGFTSRSRRPRVRRYSPWSSDDSDSSHVEMIPGLSALIYDQLWRLDCVSGDADAPLQTGYLSVNWSAGLWGRRPPLVSCWNWEGSLSSLTFSTALELHNGAI